MRAQRGVTLIDTVIGSALMLVIFLGIAGAVRLSIDVVANNKARAGALALAGERMEFLRSLSYDALGTLGGIPAGALAQEESLEMNNVSYTRRTTIQYADDPKDGLGGADATGIADYKVARVSVAWNAHTGERSVALVSRFEPASGLESAVSGGTLVVRVQNATGADLANARVEIQNDSVNPAVDLTTYTNANGTISLIGAPAGSGYEVSVTKGGYSSAGTYSSSGGNPNPSPAHLTLSNGQTTNATFAIDALSSFTIITKAYGSGAPITNVPVTLRGAKTIGTNPTVYKYTASVGGSGGATTTVSNLEWDAYTMSVSASTGYNLAVSCEAQPVSLDPNSSKVVTLYLAPHTTRSLPVLVTSSADGSLLSGASVRLYKSGYDVTQTTGACGQTFFSGLTSGAYSITVSKSGYSTFNGSNVQASTTPQTYSVSL